MKAPDRPIPARHLLGAEGERRAGEALLAAGYQIVGRNVRAGRGEIDIVARDGDAWVFVEVKTRRGSDYGSASESITLTKQARLLRAARAWLDERELGDIDWRFDVVTVTYPMVGFPAVEIIRNAFGD